MIFDNIWYTPRWGFGYYSEYPGTTQSTRARVTTTGWIFTINNNVAFSWRSRKQSVLADSTGAAELIAATDASKQNIWLRRLFHDFGFTQHSPTSLFEDNESCIKLSRNYCSHHKVKHLDLRVMLVREHHNRSLTELVPVRTFDPLADPFTKTVSGPETTRFRNWMLRGELPTDLDLRMATTLSATPG